MIPTLYLSLYLILWLFTFFVLRLYFKSPPRLGYLFILLYALSALIAIWVVNQNLYYKSEIYRFDIVSFDGLFYLWFVLLLFATPLFLIKTDNIKNIYLSSDETKSSWKTYLVYFSIICFIVVGVISCYGKLPYLTAMQNTLAVTDVGEFSKSAFGEENHTAFRSNTFTRMSFGFYNSLINIMLCFCFYFALKGKKKICILLFVFSFLIPIVFGILGGARQQVITQMLTFCITYLLFQGCISTETQKKIKKWSLIFVFVLLLPVVFITILRFGDDFSVAIFSLLRYLGESPINFASELFEHQSGLLYGVTCFPSFFGIPISYRKFIILHTAGVQGYIFYTFIGDFILDVGAKIVFVAGVFIAFLSFVSGFFRIKNNSLSMGKLILFQTWAILCIHGMFFFQYMISPYNPFFSLLFYLVLSVRIGKKS